ncbi:MAG: hypothetical protein FJ387_20560 [Verrucomicrobia bacterium]|nr:hypothetical protein [Verrucomicrobiota bacterium]
MSPELDFIGPTDRPALALLSTPEWLAAAKTALLDAGYKLHAPRTHAEFASHFAQIQYQLVIAELSFAAPAPAENLSLLNLQSLPMSQRRHAVLILLGEPFQTLEPLAAFQHSVHAVVHPADLPNLERIIQKVVAETSLLYSVYHGVQAQLARGLD